MSWIRDRELGFLAATTVAVALILIWPYLSPQASPVQRAKLRAAFIWLITHWRGALGVSLALVIIFFWIPYGLPSRVDMTSAANQYWWGVMSGNWSPSSYPALLSSPSARPNLSESQRFWFTFSAVMAVLLNNAVIIVVIGAVWRLLYNRREKMEMSLETLFALSNIELENKLTKALVASEFVPASREADLKKTLHGAILAAQESLINRVLSRLDPKRPLEEAKRDFDSLSIGRN